MTRRGFLLFYHEGMSMRFILLIIAILPGCIATNGANCKDNGSNAHSKPSIIAHSDGVPASSAQSDFGISLAFGIERYGHLMQDMQFTDRTQLLADFGNSSIRGFNGTFHVTINVEDPSATVGELSDAIASILSAVKEAATKDYKPTVKVVVFDGKHLLLLDRPNIQADSGQSHETPATDGTTKPTSK
jgi:hypothetical protein